MALDPQAPYQPLAPPFCAALDAVVAAALGDAGDDAPPFVQFGKVVQDISSTVGGPLKQVDAALTAAGSGALSAQQQIAQLSTSDRGGLLAQTRAALGAASNAESRVSAEISQLGAPGGSDTAATLSGLLRQVLGALQDAAGSLTVLQAQLTMVPVPDEQKEALAQQLLINYYAPELAGLPDTPDGNAQLAAAEAGLVEQFKWDLRNTEPEDYDPPQVEIVIALASLNYWGMRVGVQKGWWFSKVIPEQSVINYVHKISRGQPADPALYGFGALAKYSASLSPAQIVAQFGLDYVYLDASGAPVHPYIEEVSPGVYRPIDALFFITMPLTDAIVANARVPMDPRMIEQIKRYRDGGGDPQVRWLAQDILDVVAPLTRNPPQGYTSKVEWQQVLSNVKNPLNSGGQDAPYAGNGMPQYGEKLEGCATSFAAIIQEVYLRGAPVPARAQIWARGMAPGRTTQGQDAYTPVGKDSLRDLLVAEYNGSAWRVNAQMGPKDLPAGIVADPQQFLTQLRAKP